MTLKNPKQKGNSHERAVAKILTSWSGHEFHRTPMSGALRWANDTRIVSDIVPSQELIAKGWMFSIECKNTENSWEFNTLIEGTAVFWKQWEQCVDDANREGLKPMLVFTKNYRDTFMAIQRSEFDKLKIEPESFIFITHKSENLVILKLTDFLALVSLETLLEKLGKI